MSVGISKKRGSVYAIDAQGLKLAFVHRGHRSFFALRDAIDWSA